MLLKYRYFLVIAIIVFLFLGQSAWALELGYPPLPEAPKITGNSSLTEYLVYFFILAVMTAGAVGVISIVVSGIQIMLNFGSPEAVSSARKRIFDAILGIILLMSSFIILGTINYELVSPRVTKEGRPPGLYLTDGSDYRPAPIAVQNTDDRRELDPKYTHLYYDCSPGNPLPPVYVWVYNRPNFQIDRRANGESTVDTFPLSCGNITKIRGSVKSYRWDRLRNGVYFFLLDNCNGIASCQRDGDCAQRISGNIAKFDNNPSTSDRVRSVYISNGAEASQRYGAVLNTGPSPDFKGECFIPTYSSQPGGLCFPLLEHIVNPFSSSVKILNINPFPIYNDSVTLYSKNLYVTLGPSELGIAPHYPNKSGSSHFVYEGNIDKLLKDRGQSYTGAKPDYECTGVDENGQPLDTCLVSIEPKGNYYTILYAKNEQNPRDRSCKVFEGGVNVEAGQLLDLLIHKRKLLRLDIIPKPG